LALRKGRREEGKRGKIEIEINLFGFKLKETWNTPFSPLSPCFSLFTSFSHLPPFFNPISPLLYRTPTLFPFPKFQVEIGGRGVGWGFEGSFEDYLDQITWELPGLNCLKAT
jgi:hypothetical protein